MVIPITPLPAALPEWGKTLLTVGVGIFSGPYRRTYQTLDL